MADSTSECQGLRERLTEIFLDWESVRWEEDTPNSEQINKAVDRTLAVLVEPPGDLRERLTALLVARHTGGLCPPDGPCEACDCFDPEHRQERDEADAVIAELAADPGDLREQMAAEIHAEHNPLEPFDAGRLATAALSVRWEDAARRIAAAEATIERARAEAERLLDSTHPVTNYAARRFLAALDACPDDPEEIRRLAQATTEETTNDG